MTFAAPALVLPGALALAALSQLVQSFGDFREVSGVLLPHRTETLLANPLIGAIVTTVEELDLGVELSEGLFQLRDR